MLGAINGNPLNLQAINAEGVRTFVVASVSVVQANATSASSAVASITSVMTRTNAAHLTTASGAASILAAVAHQKTSDSFTINAATAIGASHEHTFAQAFNADTDALVAALLDALQSGNTLTADALVAPLTAWLEVLQDAQTLSASGSVAIGAALDHLQDAMPLTSDGVLPIGSVLDAVDGDDTLQALLRTLVRHAAGSGLAKHGYDNPLVKHGSTSSLAKHGYPSPLAPHAGGTNVTIH